jgi:uncharacterized protein YdaU (DUF1376 family)
MLARFPVIAVFAIVAGVILGTDRVGRAFSHGERRALRALLQANDYEGARLVALRFAHKLTRDRDKARDLMGRVDSRLVRLGWDPAAISLPRYLCRLVWSEWTHGVDDDTRRREVEGAYALEQQVLYGTSAPSAEDQAVAAETKAAAEAEARAAIAKLRAFFEAEGDTVNLLWLEAALQTDGELPDVQALAAKTGRYVTEFYAAAKRRKRAVARVLGAE